MTDAAHHPKVLVVEDDDAIRGLLVSALRREPLVVHAAADGEQARNLASSNEYVLMLVDFMLPRMSGLEFLRSFRDNRPAAPTVVLVMTASDDDVIRTFASDLAHGFVRKPFDVIHLVQIVTGIAESWQTTHPAGGPPRTEWLAC